MSGYCFTAEEQQPYEFIFDGNPIPGPRGNDGKSAYELAVEKGYTGTLEEWLESLKGENGDDGKSAYELAVEKGYSGTLDEWLESLKGENGDDGKSAYELAVEQGYTGTLEEWLASLHANVTKENIHHALGFDPIGKNDIPATLPNPQPLVINEVEYDGSARKEITIEGKMSDEEKAEFAGQIVTLSDDVPESEFNQLYFEEEEHEIEIPTEADLTQIKEDLTHKVGYSEVVNGQLLMYSDATKEHLLATLDLPGGGVSDVQADGASVVQDGVAIIPKMAGGGVAGIAATAGTYGTALVGSKPYIAVINASTEQIDSRSSQYVPISPRNLDYAVKAAMCDGKGAAWTAEEQLAGRQRLGLEKKYELIDTITVGESGLWVLSAEPDGKPYSFDSVFVFRTYGSAIDPSLATGYGRVQVFYGENKAFNAECGKPASASKYNIVNVTNDHGLYICRYIRTGGYGDSAPMWASKLAKGLGWDLWDTKIRQIRNNPEDKDPPGTTISIYAIRA